MTRDPDPSADRRTRPRRLTDRVWNVRRRYAYGVPAAIAAVVAALGLYAFVLEPNRLVVRRVDVRPAGWPSGRPLRIVAIGDIHGGAPYITEKKIRSLVALANRQKPDLIALLGDYVILGVLGGRFMEPEAVAAPLADLSAPLGVYAVLGNHDWWYNGPRMAAALERAGVTVLEDRAVAVDAKDAPLYVVGVADEWTRRPDLEKAFADVPPEAPTVVLTHGPDVFPRLPPVRGLTLAAHTHGGQVRLPLMGSPIVPSRYRQRYVSGLVRENGRTLFVTSGVGTSVLPVRFRVPPEVAVVSVDAPDQNPAKPPPFSRREPF